MSEKNIETLRAQIDALSRRDLKTWLEGFDPEVEFRLPPEWPDEDIGKGREAALASMKTTLEVAEKMRFKSAKSPSLIVPTVSFSVLTSWRPAQAAEYRSSSTVTT